MATPAASPTPPRRITLLTDFGSADGYVAAMRGVIASHCPTAAIDDASHAIPPGDVQGAAHALSRYWRLYPPGTVHVVVVDPGVGSARRALVVAAQDRIALGPDNGVLEPMLSAAKEIREITNRALLVPDPSATFHGRDVFAPVAAFLARGGVLEDVGDVFGEPVRLPSAAPTQQGDRLVGRIVHVDSFGNLITNLPGADALQAEVWLGERRVGAIRRTYADVATGELLAVIGSTGMVEISLRDGSAAHVLEAGRGVTVELRK